MKSNKEIFNSIYLFNKWGWGSGVGSVAILNRPYINFINNFISDHSDIHKIIDIGCGDWQIGSHYNLKDIKYVGCDVSDVIIKRLRKRYVSKNVSFLWLDAVSDSLPDADLVITKDVMQHLSIKDNKILLHKLLKFKYVVVVNDTFNDKVVNSDISNGLYRPIDISSEPYNSKLNLVFSYTEGMRLLPNIIRKLLNFPVIKKGIYINAIKNQ